MSVCSVAHYCAVTLVVYGLVASAAAVVAVLEPYIYADLRFLLFVTFVPYHPT